jgi:EAL domain-containing protein (putative c-di-GMP-specific phosphodiesterase class I)
VTAAHEDVAAAKVCRAAIGVASAFDLIPIATGLDRPEQRDSLRDWGCAQGMGDVYSSSESTPSTSIKYDKSAAS